MRKASWPAVVAGAVLWVSGCGGDGGGSADPTASPAEHPVRGPGGLHASVVSREIEEAARAAGLTEDTEEEPIDTGLAPCMVGWTAAVEEETDPRPSYDATVTGLAARGWRQSRAYEEETLVSRTFGKGGWTLKASYSGSPDTFVSVSFVATDLGDACARRFQEELEKDEQPS